MLLTITKLSAITIQSAPAIKAVAAIEATLQRQDAWSYQTIIDLLTQDSIQLLVISQRDTVVGYCLYQVMFEQAEILRIGTHPEYQRQGIASQLLRSLHNALELTQVESLLLEVRADNVPAIALYERQEFVTIHRRKGYYQQPHQSAIDALIMQLLYR